MPRIKSPIIISFDKVSYTYPTLAGWALKDISLDIAQGEFLGIVGATGSGKSTFCLAFNGIVPQFFGGRFFGHLSVAGLDTVDTPVNELALRVGMVFEDPEMQLTSVSVESEVAFALENAGLPPEEMRKRIPAALHLMGLDGLEHRHPSELSGGQKQRLAIASALALQPDVLVLDEPASQLDPWAASSLFATLRELNQELGVTVVVASHASELLAEYCDRVAVLCDGELLSVDAPDAIFSNEALLAQAGVRASQVAEMFFRLKRLGLNISRIPVTLESSVKVLVNEEPFVVDLPPHSTAEAASLVPPGEWEFEEMMNVGTLPDEYRSQESPMVLQAEHISFAYEDSVQALDDVSLTVHAGEYLLLAGQNGAGKTTLLKQFLGLLRPQQGAVSVKGMDIAGCSVAEIAQSIGYIAQNPDRQLFCDTVAEEVAFGLKAKRLPDKEINVRVDKSLELLGLLEKWDAHPLSLTRGERTRVVIAAVLALEPDILVFDEPTVGQDYAGAANILNLTRDLHHMGKTVLVVTHHLHLMADYAHRAVILHDGKIAFDGALRDALYDADMLKAAHLIPPQAVQLVQAISNVSPLPKLLNPEEIADALTHGIEATSK